MFSDQTASQGIDFNHVAVTGDQLHMGAGGAWGDYDGDGDLDLYLVNQHGANHPYENLSDSRRSAFRKCRPQMDGVRCKPVLRPKKTAKFREVAVALGVDDMFNRGTGALFGDYDNDGDADLYVMNRGDNIMFRNDGPDGQGGWIFTDVTALLGVEAMGRTSAAAYGDFDNDGFLDLFVTNHLWPTNPGESPWVAAHRADHLYRNILDTSSGMRTFEDVSSWLNLDRLRDAIGHSVAFLDFDNNGTLDIFVVNEQMPSLDDDLTGENFVWENLGPDGDGRWLFRESASSLGFDWQGAPMGIAVGDYNNDGLFDLATSDAGPNHLCQNFSVTGHKRFADVAIQAGVDRPTLANGNMQISWGLVFLDANLDGWEDLYVPSGRLAQDDQPNALFMNNGNPPNNTFTDVSESSGADVATSSRAAIKGDYDGDGDEDIAVVTLGGSGYLLRNDQPGGAVLGVDLVGTLSNRDAIGAIVTVSAEAHPDQHRMVQSGSTTGGGHALRLTFGVTGVDKVKNVTVLWPSGRVTILADVEVNQVIQIVE